MMENGISEGFFNVGTGTDVTVHKLAETVLQVLGSEGRIVLTRTKPDGTPCKLLDVSSSRERGWHANTSLREGIFLAYQVYKQKFFR